MATQAEKVIQAAYQKALGRTADPQGLKFYTAQLESGQKNIGQIMADLSFAKDADLRARVADPATRKETTEQILSQPLTGYAPGVPGSKTKADIARRRQYGIQTSAYIPKPGGYTGGSHKVGGVELVPGAPGYDEAKAMPIVKKMIAPYDKSVQAYLEDIGELDEATKAGIEAAQAQEAKYTKLQDLAKSGQITGYQAEAAAMDIQRGVDRPDYLTKEVQKPATTPAEQTQATLDRSRAALAEEERMAAERAAARQRARMRRARPLLSEQRLAPELQL